MKNNITDNSYKRDYYESPKAGRLMKLLWKAAGGDRYLLERATYADQVKYACLGGIIVATGGLAMLAGGYAFYTIFEPKGYALDSIVLDKINLNWTDTLKMNGPQIIAFKEKAEMLKEGSKANYVDLTTVILASLFGLIWGLIIFNIDRFIVTSTGKGDGTEAITWDEFKSAIPRIVMGTIIAFTISKPIEIRMFQSEINVELSKLQDSISNAHLKIKNQTSEKLISEYKIKIENYQNEIKGKYDAYKKNEDRYLKECQGEGSARGRGCGPIAESIKHQMKVDSTEYRSTVVRNQPEIDKLNILILDEQNKQKRNQLSAIQISSGLDGLLERIKISHRLSPWISFFITLLFLAIELTPIFFKLMLIKTPYDYLADNRDDLIRAENGIEVKYDFFKDKEGLERHLVINHAKEKMIYENKLLVEAEKRLSEYALKKYEEKERQKIDDDPENLGGYILKQ
jgi:hypothetical protein